MDYVFRSRVWCVDDDIDTDLILPVGYLHIPLSERPKHVFQANRPGWAQQVKPGDILIAGRNFGMGSGRPAALVMKDLGLACLIAESINGLFFRNCVNFALPALQIPGVRATFQEGDEAEVHFKLGLVRNLRTGAQLQGKPWPEVLLRTLRAGGLVERLEAEGLLHPAGWTPPPVEVLRHEIQVMNDRRNQDAAS